MQNKNDVKFNGVYPLQQERLEDEIIEKHGTSQPVSPEWIGNRMFQICVEEMPSGFDPKNKNKFNKHWVSNYMSRKDLSVCQATNKKNKVCLKNYTRFSDAIGIPNIKWLLVHYNL